MAKAATRHGFSVMVAYGGVRTTRDLPEIGHKGFGSFGIGERPKPGAGGPPTRSTGMFWRPSLSEGAKRGFPHQ